MLLFRAIDEARDRAVPKVVLLTVESLREDMVTEETMPHLLKAAGQGHRFRQHRAISGWTATNIVSLLTGLDPFVSGVHTRGSSIAPGLTPPLVQLADAGYVVAGLQPFMAMDIYDNLGLRVNSRGLEPGLWLAEQRQANRPFFLWYHYVDTHLPYGPEPLPDDWPQDVKDRLEKVRSQTHILHDEVTFAPEDVARIHGLQARRIREFDRWFADFWTFWRASGCWRDTILIVTADHGDEHGERGMTGHASTTLAGHLHEEIVRVPLFIWLPERHASIGAAARTNDMSSHLDIMPTILARLKVVPKLPLTGRDLFASAASQDKEASRQWLGATSSGGFAEPDPARIRYFEFALWRDGWKSRLRIEADGTRQFFLYDLAADPGETRNRAGLHPEIAETHRRELLRAGGGISLSQPLPREAGRSTGDEGAEVIGWVRPDSSGAYSYEELGGSFVLQWSGTADQEYLLDYRAGSGRKELAGTLTVRGAMKDFGRIDRSYWQKWIVPHSPFRLRVREKNGPGRTQWLELEARP